LGRGLEGKGGEVVLDWMRGVGRGLRGVGVEIGGGEGGLVGIAEVREVLGEMREGGLKGLKRGLSVSDGRSRNGFFFFGVMSTTGCGCLDGEDGAERERGKVFSLSSSEALTSGFCLDAGFSPDVPPAFSFFFSTEETSNTPCTFQMSGRHFRTLPTHASQSMETQ